MSAATGQIAAFACAAHEPPAAHADHLGRALLDTVGCALAATGSPLDAILGRWLERERSSGRSTVWTTGEQTGASLAAFVNGTAAHALDWDDVSPGSAMHPSVVLLPALLAQAEELEVDGAALVAAYDVGAAVFRGVAQALPATEHYRRGWHTTSTVGRLAAVAALAALRGLDESATRSALGVAASLAAGSRANFGTMTKPLHAGAAARDALVAVALAADGLTANPMALDVEHGFFALYGEPAAVADLGGALTHWRLAWPGDWALKRYPACYATHRAIDAALRLRPGLAAGPPEEVEVVVEPGGLRPLLPGLPATPTEARFSMAYVVSVALIHGGVRLAHFTDAALGDRAVRSLLERIRVRESDVPPVGPETYADGYAVVRVAGGGECRIDVTEGDARLPLTDAALADKFADCCVAGGLDGVAGDRLRTRLLSLPRTAGAIGSIRAPV